MAYYFSPCQESLKMILQAWVWESFFEACLWILFYTWWWVSLRKMLWSPLKSDIIFKHLDCRVGCRTIIVRLRAYCALGDVERNSPPHGLIIEFSPCLSLYPQVCLVEHDLWAMVWVDIVYSLHVQGCEIATTLIFGVLVILVTMV